MAGRSGGGSYALACGARLPSRVAADLVAGIGEGLCEADRAVGTKENAADALANFRETLRVSADGWIDDDLSAVKPWGFDASEVAVPTTLWYGTEDRLVPVTHDQWLAARIPGMVAHFVEGEGHISIGARHLDRMLRELVAVSTGRL